MAWAHINSGTWFPRTPFAKRFITSPVCDFEVAKLRAWIATDRTFLAFGSAQPVNDSAAALREHFYVSFQPRILAGLIHAVWFHNRVTFSGVIHPRCRGEGYFRGFDR